MNLRYRCLILDHDDTVTNSTVEINYPNFVRSMERFRPDTQVSFEEFVRGNFDPGFFTMMKEWYNYTDEEMACQYEFWQSDTMNNRPSMVKGMADFLKKYHEVGGCICVATHSMAKMVLIDYNTNCGFEPKYITSWESPDEQRKPSPFTVEYAMRELGFERSDILVVDDLPTGMNMAKVAEVDFAAAGWCYDVEPVTSYMRANSKYYLTEVAQLEALVFAESLQGVVK